MLFIFKLAEEAMSIKEYPNKTDNKRMGSLSSDGRSKDILYRLLSGSEDIYSAQKRSHLVGSIQPRSNSVREGSLGSLNYLRIQHSERPSSAPYRTRYTPYPSAKCCGTNFFTKSPKAIKTSSNLPTNITSPSLSNSTDSGLDEPVDLSKNYSNSTYQKRLQFETVDIDRNSSCSSNSNSSAPDYVQLAKKAQRPVQRFVSQCLHEMTNLLTQEWDNSNGMNSEIYKIQPSDRIRILKLSWYKLLILYMAEDNLQIVTSNCTNKTSQFDSSTTAAYKPMPSKAFVEDIQNTINVLNTLDVCALNQLKTFVVLASACTLLRGEEINVWQLSRETEISHYIKSPVQQRSMLSLWNFDPKLIESLFCGHLKLPIHSYIDSLLTL